jgi:hypothetical protein
MADKTKLPFLVMSRHHLSPTKARNAIIAVLQRCNLGCPDGDWDKTVVTMSIKDKPPIQATFPDMVKEARENGIVRLLQRPLDKNDNIFGGTYEDFCTANYQIRITSEWAEFKIETQGPCRTSCPTTDLTEDILYARRQTCEHSNEYDFIHTCRHFRNYLSACMSLADSFVNRNIHVAKANGFTSPAFEELQKTIGLERKLELLWTMCSTEDLSLLLDSSHYCHFQELRTKRNALLHAVEPIATYSLRDIQSYLNKVRSGIGELLLLFRTAHGKPTLGFIERLRSAPKVAFHKVHLRAEGDRIEHIKQD